MRRRSFHRSLWAAFAALLLVVLGPSALAAPNSWLEFSEDGKSWSRIAPSALFTEHVVLVPGDSASGVLHLRSTAESAGLLTVSIANVTASPNEAAEAFDLGILSEMGEGFSRAPLDAIIGADGSVASYTLQSGESVALTVTVGLDAAITGRVAQNSVIGLDIKVSFIDAQTAPGGDVAPQNPPPSQTIPLLPPSHSQEPTDQAPDAIAEERRAVAVEREPVAREGPFIRGPLAVTGITGGALLVTAAMMLAGGVLALAMRRRRERQ